MGWPDGGDNCINAFGDYNEINHYKYENIHSSYDKLCAEICNEQHDINDTCKCRICGKEFHDFVYESYIYTPRDDYGEGHGKCSRCGLAF